MFTHSQYLAADELISHIGIVYAYVCRCTITYIFINVLSVGQIWVWFLRKNCMCGQGKLFTNEDYNIASVAVLE